MKSNRKACKGASDFPGRSGVESRLPGKDSLGMPCFQARITQIELG